MGKNQSNFERECIAVLLLNHEIFDIPVDYEVVINVVTSKNIIKFGDTAESFMWKRLWW